MKILINFVKYLTHTLEYTALIIALPLILLQMVKYNSHHKSKTYEDDDTVSLYVQENTANTTSHLKTKKEKKDTEQHLDPIGSPSGPVASGELENPGGTVLF